MRDILNSYSASDLKKEISKYNKKVAIRGYSKMTKSELVNEMMKHQDTFNYLKKKEKAPKAAAAKPAPKPAAKKDLQEYNYLVSGNPKSKEMYGDLLNKIGKIHKKNETLLNKNKDFIYNKSEELFQKSNKQRRRGGGRNMLNILRMHNDDNLTRKLDLELTKNGELDPKFEQKNKFLLNKELDRLNELNKRINNEIEKLKKA